MKKAACSVVVVIFSVFTLLPSLQAEPVSSGGDPNAPTPIIEIETAVPVVTETSTQTIETPTLTFDTVSESQTEPDDFVLADFTEWVQPTTPLEIPNEEKIPGEEGFATTEIEVPNSIPDIPLENPDDDLIPGEEGFVSTELEGAIRDPAADSSLLREVPRQILDQIRTMAPHHRIVYSGVNRETGARFFVLHEPPQGRGDIFHTLANRNEVRYRIIFVDPEAGGAREAAILTVNTGFLYAYHNALSFNVLYRTNHNESYMRVTIHGARRIIRVAVMNNDGTMPRSTFWEWSEVPDAINTTVIPVRDRFPAGTDDYDRGRLQEIALLNEYHSRLMDSVPVDPENNLDPLRSIFDDDLDGARQRYRYLFRAWQDAVGREESTHLDLQAIDRTLQFMSNTNLARLERIRREIYARILTRIPRATGRGIVRDRTRPFVDATRPGDTTRPFINLNLPSRLAITYTVDGRMYYWPDGPAAPR